MKRGHWCALGMIGHLFFDEGHIGSVSWANGNGMARGLMSTNTMSMSKYDNERIMRCRKVVIRIVIIVALTRTVYLYHAYALDSR